MRKIFMLTLIGMLVCGLAFAAGNKNDLAYLATTELETASTVLATDEIIIVKSDIPMQGMTVSDLSKVNVAGIRVKTTTRNTTILATETGKTFICTANSKFQLPPAAEGLNYTFVTVGSAEVEIQVNTTPDTIVLVSAGDGDGSQGKIETGINTTGNTITLISDGTSWYAMTKYTSEAGWVDGGVWLAFSTGENE